MRTVLTAATIVITATCSGHAALVWESTFDSDADGVVNGIRNNELCAPSGDPCPDVFGEGFGNGAVMIGPNTGGVQQITTQSLAGGFTETNKAGRLTSDSGGPASLDKDGSWSALYTFNWTLGGGLIADGQGAAYLAGAFEPFDTGSQRFSTRRHMGARFIRQVNASGDDVVNIGGSWASEGFVGVGRNFAGDVNLNTALGADPDGHPLQLAMGYDGTTKVLTVSLHNGITGDVLTDGNNTATSSADIQMFDNLGVPPGHPFLNMELDALNNTHVGWTDFTQDVNAIDTIWNMDSLRFYDDPMGAFDDVVSVPVLLGDANKDGQVTGADLISVQQNFGNVGPTPLQGDANNDGQVTGADLISVQQNFGNVAAPAGTAVPEPASMALLGAGVLTVLAGRRRFRDV